MRHALFPFALVLTALLLAPGFQTPAEAGGSRAQRQHQLVRQLQTRRLKNVAFKAVDLPGLLKWLRTATGHNFVLDRRSLQKAGIDPKDVTFTAKLDNVTVVTVLGLALPPHKLSAVVKGNVIWITTHANRMGKPVTRLYGISHITWQKIDFRAPDMNLQPSNYMAPEEFEPETPVEDDPLATGDQVAELLMELVGRGEWDNEGWSMSATRRHLVVRAPRSVHRKIPRALKAIASLK